MESFYVCAYKKNTDNDNDNNNNKYNNIGIL